MITSVSNRTVQAVRRLGKRPWRDSQGRSLCEGHAVARAAIDAGAVIHTALHTSQAARRRTDLLRRIAGTGAELFVVSDDIMAWLCGHPSPPDVLCVIQTPAIGLTGLPTDPASLLMAGIADPAQAGGILSVAASLGLASAACAIGSVDPFDPKAMRAGRGAQFSIPTARGLSASAVIAHHREAGARVVAVGSGGSPWTADLSGSVLFVLGEEGVEDADTVVSFPAGTSIGHGASMLLYEWWRQRSI